MPASAVARIGRRIRSERSNQKMSLSTLAHISGVGKGSLSEIENGARNPTLETLYAISGALAVPLTTLIGDDGATADAAGGMRSVVLDVRRLPDGDTAEVLRLHFPEDAQHTSPAHGPGVREHLTVISGSLRVGTPPRTVTAGNSTSWDSDRPHSYQAIDGSAEAIVVITTPAAPERGATETPNSQPSHHGMAT